jgi:hypothetical protein
MEVHARVLSETALTEAGIACVFRLAAREKPTKRAAKGEASPAEREAAKKLFRERQTKGRQDRPSSGLSPDHTYDARCSLGSERLTREARTLAPHGLSTNHFGPPSNTQMGQVAQWPDPLEGMPRTCGSRCVLLQSKARIYCYICCYIYCYIYCYT